MNFRLTRLILIGAYCHNRIVEIDLTGHITINGENGAGKTTLLRLLPIFFGEKPSNIIRSDAVVEKFGRYYFPTTSSYVIFEYQRRDQIAMSVVHADGQNDSVVYRLIDSEYKPELFRDAQGVVQTNKLHGHLEKLGVLDSKPLTLQAYKQIMQNTAGREHKHLLSRFAFTGASGRLTHLERIVTGILLRITTFYDLKKMIVSSVLDGDEVFSLRTSRKDLLQWVSEYEAHYAVMEKSDLMQELETLDHQRRDIETGFSRLHAKLKLLHDHHDSQVSLAEGEELSAKNDKKIAEEGYGAKLLEVNDKLSAAKSNHGQLQTEVNNLHARRKRYDQEGADQKVSQFEAIPAHEAELSPLKSSLRDMEGQVKSIVEIFDQMESEAQQHASELHASMNERRVLAYQQSGERKNEISEKHAINRQEILSGQQSERDVASDKLNKLKLDRGVHTESLKNVQADPESLELLRKSQTAERDANHALQSLHEQTQVLRRAQDQVKQQFEDIEAQINGGERAIENTEEELERLLAADSAGEDTLLGFLRLNKPEWASNIGRVVPEDVLLRNDLSPSMAEGLHLYGISIDLEKLSVGRFASEEELQREIKSLKERLQRKQAEVKEDQGLLEKKRIDLDAARQACTQHDAAISLAKTALSNAQSARKLAEARVEQSRKTQQLAIQEKLDRCNEDLKSAENAFAKLKAAHQKQLDEVDSAYKTRMSDADNALKSQEIAFDAEKKNIEQELKEKLVRIASDRDQSLRDNGVSPDTMNRLRGRIAELEDLIESARKLSQYVLEYRTWLQSAWSAIQENEIATQTAKSVCDQLERARDDLLKERQRILEEKDRAIDAAGKKIDSHVKARSHARSQMQLLSIWPMDNDVISTGLDNAWAVDALSGDRHRLQGSLDECREAIRVRVEEIRRQMCKEVGTCPERFYSTALNEIGNRPGREHDWIEVFRTWYGDRHNENRNSLTQMGKTMAQNISHFWKTLASFKRDVTTFSTDLKSHLDQGRIFDSISDVSAEIRTHVDTQDYWEAVQELHHEYDAWHTLGDLSLPPKSFVDAAKRVATVVSDEKGLVADPVDLVSLKISANVNNQGVRTASNEHELTHMSSNGLSYIILCVILIGFVNRIRRKDPVVVPFVVDELKDLSYVNAKTLLELLTRNNITMVSAFPDVDLDLAELFSRNYKILPGREIGLIDLEATEEETEADHV